MRPLCAICRIRESALSYRAFVRDYKRTHPCVDCGESDWRCLDFDHNGDKSFELSKSTARSIATIKREIAKCVVRCANCHRKRHQGTEFYQDFMAFPTESEAWTAWYKERIRQAFADQPEPTADDPLIDWPGETSDDLGPDDYDEEDD